MYKTDLNKNNGNPGMRNAIGIETLAAPMCEENPNQLYPQMHIETNPMPISSIYSERRGNDPNVV